jgi:hypothetical protein
MPRHRYFGQVRRKKLGPNPLPTCFVVMPFRPRWADNVWKVLRSALGKCRIRPIRADLQSGPIIIQDIYEDIYNATLVVVDATGMNANVFYELGLAHSLEKSVIIITQSIDDIPFDTTHVRAIKYVRGVRGYRELAGTVTRYIRELNLVQRYLPKHTRINWKSRTLSATSRKFMGIWDGTWKGKRAGSLHHTLIVRDVVRRRVDLVYAWGESPEWGIRAGYLHHYGRIQDKQLLVEWPSITVSYELTRDPNRLLAKRVDSNGKFRAELQRAHPHP